MKKEVIVLLLLLAIIFVVSEAETTSLQPRAFESFNVSYIQVLLIETVNEVILSLFSFFFFLKFSFVDVHLNFFNCFI